METFSREKVAAEQPDGWIAPASLIDSLAVPTARTAVLEAVRWAAAEEMPLEIVGHGSKRGIGRPLQTEYGLDLSDLSGVTLYEPEELVLLRQAGTPLADIERLLADHNQMLAFEPMDFGPLFGGRARTRHDRRRARRRTRAARAASRRAPRATMSSASRPSPGAARRSSRAGAS